MKSSSTQQRARSPWWLGRQIARYRLGRFAAGVALWTAFFSVPALTGLVLRWVFDAIAGTGEVGWNVPTLLALLVAVEATRLIVFYGGIRVFVNWWVQLETLLRTNLLSAQLANDEAAQGPPVTSASKAIPVFRDDVEDMLKFVDVWLDMTGLVLFAGVALVVMAAVDPMLTLVVALPLVVVFAAAGVIAERLRHARRADREATAAVTGLLGTVFSSVQALKVAGAEEAAVGTLRGLNEQRRRTALRDRLLNEALEAFSGSTVDVTIGLVLLLAAGSMRAGEFTVGDLALFASYISTLAHVPRVAGILLARQRHAQVAASRMAGLLPEQDSASAVAHRPLNLRDDALRARPRAQRDGPATVELVGFGTADGRVSGVDLHLPAGSFTVVCGEVGSGKSSLLRALLGLAGPTEGIVRWDGAEVDDLAAHMTPPRCAYVPQVPRLFSASLRENLTVGLATSDASVTQALRRAAFDGDLEEMAAGLDTLVGPRGVRLSGGQLQRAATGRALVADPALLVLDDLSSALDADTERRVWARVAEEQRTTVLAVSHRAGALERADQVVMLGGGRVVVRQSRDGVQPGSADPASPEGASNREDPSAVAGSGDGVVEHRA